MTCTKLTLWSQTDQASSFSSVCAVYSSLCHQPTPYHHHHTKWFCEGGELTRERWTVVSSFIVQIWITQMWWWICCTTRHQGSNITIYAKGHLFQVFSGFLVERRVSSDTDSHIHSFYTLCAHLCLRLYCVIHLDCFLWAWLLNYTEI